MSDLTAFLDRRRAGESGKPSPLRLACMLPAHGPSQLPALDDLPDGSELHLVGPDEAVQPAADVATIHPARSRAAMAEIIANLVTSGGVDGVIVLPDPREDSPGWKSLLAELRRPGMCGLTLVHPEPLGRPLLLADTEVHDTLDGQTGAEVLDSTLPVLRRLGIATPRVAALAAVEVKNDGLPATVWADAVARRFDDRDDVFVHGPLSLDLAVSELAAQKKKATGEVAGRADLLLAPNLTVARAIRAALHHGFGMETVTMLVGAGVPVMLAARGAGRDGATLAARLVLALR